MSITLVLNVLMTALLIWEETTIQQDSVSIKGFWTLKKRKIIFETFLIHIVKILIEIFHLVSAIIVFIIMIKMETYFCKVMYYIEIYRRGFLWQFYTQLFASSYIWLAYIFDASYSTVVTSVSKKSSVDQSVLEK